MCTAARDLALHFIQRWNNHIRDWTVDVESQEMALVRDKALHGCNPMACVMVQTAAERRKAAEDALLPDSVLTDPMLKSKEAAGKHGAQECQVG